ncbi:hypothetical protein CKO11_04275 [Rhodobacter sp. TJ_12]|uniref:hypothetical protein n=1 Tax=Rhodobacter sp. TJ_12 TaxID=2029399 RepID=UPI001CBB5D1D|nr:hypothetical protein [Rhodobacter sp. TJ_12]MBZ4021676.1 hypothetical protein [Rhodobacter sp. TJ_12]
MSRGRNGRRFLVGLSLASLLALPLGAQTVPGWQITGTAAQIAGPGADLGRAMVRAARLCAKVVLQDDRAPLAGLDLLSQAPWGRTTERFVYAGPRPDLRYVVLMNAGKPRRIAVGDCFVELDPATPTEARDGAMAVVLAWAGAEVAAGRLRHDPCDNICAQHQTERGGWQEDFFACAGPDAPMGVSGGYYDSADTLKLSLSRFAILGSWRKHCPGGS